MLKIDSCKGCDFYKWVAIGDPFNIQWDMQCTSLNGCQKEHMDIYIFKIKDYTTVMVGQMFINDTDEKAFYVQKGDGMKYVYEEYRVQWYKEVCRKII